MHQANPPTASPAHPDSCLHLVVSCQAQVLDDCLAHLGAADAVLFLDQGVMHLLRSGPGSLAGTAAAVYFAAADLEAQGLAALAARSQVDVLDDAGFCELLARHRHCLTWA
jgi:sulfur relay protein TusB/DsrH